MNYYPEPTPEHRAILASAKRIDHNPTVEENLDERIRYLESE